MRLAALFSGGKDSCYAIYKAMDHHEVSCLVTVRSKNQDSFMFHTPNIELTNAQAECIGLPLITAQSDGNKEEELDDLKVALAKAKVLFEIEGVVTGAIESVYQASRVQRICDELGLWCFSPLWKKDQIELLNELIKNKFDIMLSSVAAYPFDEKWLGRKIDAEAIKELGQLKDKHMINPAGEGGEYESLVLDAPFFNKRIRIILADKEYSNNAGRFNVRKYELDEK
jgi:ABC transporter with metal-binding/Fe-S-binding domain ATP-binding protein